MTKRLTPPLAICCAGVAFAIVAAAFDLGADKVKVPSAVAADGTPVVVIENFAFSGSTVAPGATVEVRNADGAPHTVTEADNLFDSGIIDAGATGSFVAPTAPGTYRILCNVHPSMKGELIVQ
jgi:plastocyanin